MNGVPEEAAAIGKLWLEAKSARQSGNLAASTEHLRRALAIAPDNPLILRQLAVQLRHAGALQEALALLEPALPLAIEHPDLALTLADCLLQQGGPRAALATLDYVLRQRGDQPAELLLGKARLHYMQHEFPAAEAALRDVVRQSPQRAEAWSLLSAIAIELGRDEEAGTASRLALKIDPKQVIALGTKGQLAAEAGDSDAARHFFDRALALEPDNARIHYMLGLLDLSLGNYAAGWRGFAWRHRVTPRIAADFSYGLPAWQPAETAPQGRLLIWGEQGIGDEIMFAGMVSGLLVREVRPLLLTDPRLAPLFSRSLPGIDVAARHPGFAPRSEGITRQIAAGDLGALLRPDRAAFPVRSRYLAADPARVRHFRAKYAELARGNKLVGIAWRSSNAAQGPYKSLALDDFAPLLRQPGCCFINLQYGNNAAEIAALRETHGLVLHDDDEVDPLRSLEDQAAQIAALDCVVSTSNSAVHLAGALGVPTWLLLPHRGRGVQWYWGQAGAETPWYSSLRLLRSAASETLAVQLQRRMAEFAAWLADFRAVTAN
ncbi:tetratricopeptide repeat protein [Ferrovibrio sp. MS7]